MDLTRERALELHRAMWSDMQRDLGDCPSLDERQKYKKAWCMKHGWFGIPFHCFLCAWSGNNGENDDCNCPINWNFDGKNIHGNCCIDGTVDYTYSPISEILALPEREDV